VAGHAECLFFRDSGEVELFAMKDTGETDVYFDRYYGGGDRFSRNEIYGNSPVTLVIPCAMGCSKLVLHNFSFDEQSFGDVVTLLKYWSLMSSLAGGVENGCENFKSIEIVKCIFSDINPSFEQTALHKELTALQRCGSSFDS